MFRLEFDTSAVQRTLNTLARSLEAGFPRASRQIASHMARSIDLNFRQGGRPNKWVALKPATVKARRRWSRRTRRRLVAQDNTPLRVTDELRLSVTATRPGVRSSLFERTGSQITFGTARAGAARNQRTRAFLLFQEADRVEIKAALKQDVDEKIRQAQGDR